ncbi:hypothetical protein [Streptococcus alactolyticus]|uniref:hypothetical protein n=1 Tax=Streptococcus alactolyticus TaxID=29389 RepID=UPI003F96BBAE
MGLFVYTQKGSIISMVDLPTTEIIEPEIIEMGWPLAVPFYDFFVIIRIILIFVIGWKIWQIG